MIFMFLLATFKLDFVDGCEIGTTVLCECVCVCVCLCVCVVKVFLWPQCKI